MLRDIEVLPELKETHGAQRDLVARIYISSVEIINAELNGTPHLAFRLIKVYGITAFCKSHTAVAQYRDRLTVFAVSVIHNIFLLSYNHTFS